MRSIKRMLLTLFMLLATTGSVTAAQVNVAAASNFNTTLQELAVEFRRATGHELRISTASTGKLYAQIVQGAPYDVFLAADAERPARLVRQGLAVADSRFTYAQGQLLLWSPQSRFADNGPEELARGEFRHLAIANPQSAPYGVAAKQTLESLHLWTALKPRLVRGENIGQTFQYVATGAADLGFVSRSQVLSLSDGTGYRWPVPAQLHHPIRQQAVLLNSGGDNPAATAFLTFLKTDKAVELITDNGYLAGREGSE